MCLLVGLLGSGAARHCMGKIKHNLSAGDVRIQVGESWPSESARSKRSENYMLHDVLGALELPLHLYNMWQQ